MTRRRWLALAAGAAALAWPGAGQGLTVVDVRGRRLELVAPPRRIVSLVPSATEIIFALGGQDRLAGRTDYCDFPPAARSKPSVGGMLTPSLETIVLLGADLVIATDSGNRRETMTQIEQLGIPVYLVHARRVADVMEVIARLGALTGRQDAVGPLVDRLSRRVAAVEDAVRGRGRPRVLYVLWPDPLIVPGRDALVTELIERAGGTSITAAEPGDYPRFSIEAAVARAPEVIVLARHGSTSGAIDRQRWDRLSSLPAVRAGRLHAVDGDLLHRYGPRMVDGLEHLARLLHPEAFP